MATPAELEAPAPVETTLTHLQLVPCSEQYARLADLQVKHDKKLFPCHSSVLAMYSKVLCTMFDGTDRQEWASGVAAALAGHALEDFEFFLTLVHSPGVNLEDVRKALGVEHAMLGVAKLAHKLDSSLVLDIIDSFLSETIDTFTWNDPKDTRNMPLFWLPKVETFQMSKTKAACMIRVLNILINNKVENGDHEKMDLGDLPGCNKELWEALAPDTLMALLRGVVRVRNPADHSKIELDSLAKLSQ